MWGNIHDGSEALLWHNNLGTTWGSEDKKLRLTWGTGLEHEFTDTVSLYAEIFGEGSEAPTFHIAAGYWLKPEVLEVTLGIADNFTSDTEQQWISLGLNWHQLAF